MLRLRRLMTAMCVCVATAAGAQSAQTLTAGTTLIATGDSLNTGHGLPGFLPPGYPNDPPLGAWPELLGAMPDLSPLLNVRNGAVDGYTLAQSIILYPVAVHPFTMAVTGKPCIVAISIFGNDAARIGPGLTYETLEDYEAAYTAWLATIRADRCRVMFLEQWVQTGRERYSADRIAFNEWNRKNVDFYVETAKIMSDSSDLRAYEPDGLHETAAASVKIAQAAKDALTGQR